MKTAEEIAKKWVGEVPDSALKIAWLDIREGMKKDIEDYAKQVAQDALNRAAENAEGVVDYEGQICIDFKSITETEIILT